MNAHLTDDELLDDLYGIQLQTGHLSGCAECRDRLLAMRNARQTVDREWALASDLDPHFLAAQRRRIFARIEAGTSLWIPVRRWAPAALMLVFLTGGGVAVFEHDQHRTPIQSNSAPAAISDDELARQVSQIAENPEPPAAAPIEALFED